MQKSDIGLIGLAVMGENLALNFESKGFTVSVYNRLHPGKENVVDRFVGGRGKGKHFTATYSISGLVASLSRPRKVMLMIRAGKPVDEMVSELAACLEEGDVIIDGGNSDFRDTERRMEVMGALGIYYVGAGISGGEMGALTGPSIMPGGSPEAWSLVKDLLQGIAAKLDDGTPCCQWIGSGGAGHYVKMIHNGIEYGDMQLIAESYFMLKTYWELENIEIAEVLEEWNRGELNSYLMGITAEICRRWEPRGGYLLDRILDVAGQKGTGKWTAEAALNENDPLTLVTEAVYARFLSAMPEERAMAADLYRSERRDFSPERTGITEGLRHALYASKLVSYAQGFALLRRAAGHYGWTLNYGMIAKIWREGCIIRSAFLEQITQAYDDSPNLENLLFADFFRERIRATLPDWRRVTANCLLAGIPVPCLASALTYFDGLCTRHSSANLIQAQRDYFGAHTYERTDALRGQFFHTDWNDTGGIASGTYTV
ncbi:MAG: decarboxylating NADP(+)-dependent phosphogluconate dehydrogenase [Odoribacter sp.]